MQSRDPLPPSHVPAQDAVVIAGVVFVAWCFAVVLFGIARSKGWIW
jgi:hypothetical protein